MPGHVMEVYAPPPLDIERGEGVRLYAKDGLSYLDFIAGIAVNALGYGSPVFKKAVTAQMDTGLVHLSNMFRIPGQQELADAYCAATFADRVFFTNSGTEAVECAIKTARKHHFANNRPERIKIVGFQGAFHGRTYAGINAAGNAAYLEGFGPPMPGFVHVPWGDRPALEREVDETCAAILIEPVQGEGGVRAASDDDLRYLRKLCDDRGCLLIYDEVQCGALRTGRLFAHQWVEGAEPDIMAVAKGVGAGFPLGACLATEKAADGMKVGAHGSTYGGNPLAMAVGLAVWKELAKPEMAEHVNAIANQLRQGLHGLADAHSDVIEELRGKGLLLGVKLKRIANKDVRDAARERGLLIGMAGDNVVRLAPPLVLSPQDASQALEILDASLAAVKAGAKAEVKA